VPDFYQGTELWDLSLVDPDNRRPVDFDSRMRLLQLSGPAPDWRALAANWSDGRIKLALTARLLSVRREFGDIFANGRYRTVEVLGPDRDQIIAFARMNDRTAIIVAAARSFAHATAGGRCWPYAAGWNGQLDLKGFAEPRNLLAPEATLTGSEPSLSQLFDALPVGLLQAELL
jgi:(1->4)-alpha-D-glucan 1-alpha-D-glucosylmutase